MIRSQHEKHQMASIRTKAMEPETTTNIAYIVMGITLFAMVWFISQRAMKNRADVLEASAPKIAGMMFSMGEHATHNNSTSPMKKLWKKWRNYSVMMTSQRTKPES